MVRDDATTRVAREYSSDDANGHRPEVVCHDWWLPSAGERPIDWSWSSASERPGIGQQITNANGN